MDSLNTNVNSNAPQNANEENHIIVPSTMATNIPPIDWTEEHEQIMIDWADKALCYKWLHQKAHSEYRRKNTWFTIPVIIMSTLTGTANFAQDRIPPEFLNLATMIIGTINLIAGILTTIQRFLKITELNEAHRACTISWDKFYRNVKVELTKNRNERMNPYQMIKSCKEEFDRLIETSPTIPLKIVQDFKWTFSGGRVKNLENMTPQQRAYQLIKKPAICDILQSTSLSVFKEDVNKKILTKNTKHLVIKANQERQDQKTIDQINNIIDDFKKEYKRRPSIEEINDNLDGQVNYHFINNALMNDTSRDLEEG